jgi:hypothetical protein
LLYPSLHKHVEISGGSPVAMPEARIQTNSSADPGLLLLELTISYNLSRSMKLGRTQELPTQL